MGNITSSGDASSGMDGDTTSSSPRGVRGVVPPGGNSGVRGVVPPGRAGSAPDPMAALAIGRASGGVRGVAPRGDNSGVGVLDKAVAVLAAVESGPATLAQLVAATGLARPTTHRIAVALEHHRLLARDVQGRFVLGPRVGELASAAGEDRLLAVSQPVLVQLRDVTGESAQLYRLAGGGSAGDVRVCVAAAERASGLRDTVPVGAALPMTAGSAAQILLAWEEGERMHRGLRGAKFTATTLAGVRRRGWAASAAERELGVASVSAPVRGAGGKVLAAVSVSGPIERLTRSPGRLHANAVLAAGERIGELLRSESTHRGS
jgi:DNA-binding IclR family transcriptional regulator